MAIYEFWSNSNLESCVKAVAWMKRSEIRDCSHHDHRPALRYAPCRLRSLRLIATDIVHVIPLAMFAGLGHLLMGNVYFGLLGNLLAASIPAVIVGRRYRRACHMRCCAGPLAVVLLIIGIKLLWTVLQ